MKLSIPHWVIVLVTLLGTTATEVAAAFPTLAPALGVVHQIDVLVLGVMGILTGSALTSKAVAPKVAMSMLMLYALATIAISQALVACKATQVAAPSSVAAVACVVDDAIAGKSVSQIVLDCGGDVAQVISILADPANYPQTKGTAAYAEAGRAKTAAGAVQ